MLTDTVANPIKHIEIIGAGFGGLKLARKLNNHPHYKSTLIDKNNYHQFQPIIRILKNCYPSSLLVAAPVVLN